MESIARAQESAQEGNSTEGREEREWSSAEISAIYRGALGPNYLRRKWLPAKGPAFCALVDVFRLLCEEQTACDTPYECSVTVTELARATRLSPSTVHRLLNDPDMANFVARVPEYTYCPSRGRWERRASRYIVAIDDPPIPEDEHLVDEMAETWRARSLTVTEPIEIEESMDIQTERFSGDIHRIEDDVASQRQDKPAAPECDPLPSRSALPPIEAATATAEAILDELGGASPSLGAQVVVRALAAAETPPTYLQDLLYLGRARLRQFQMRGGRIENKAGYYIQVMKRLAGEACACGWDLAALRAQDDQRHQQALARADMRGSDLRPVAAVG